jgi:ABC-type phosphate/phosphonate transport system substrate-binding protein
MDPLAGDLACACIPGFAQRQYRALSPVLAKELGRPIELQFSASLEQHLAKSPTGKVDLVIGQDSVVRADADKLQVPLMHFGYLTDTTGKTTHHGLFVVPGDDEEAKTIADLKSYKIFFGSPNAQEKYAAAIATLTENGIEVPKDPQTFTLPIDAVFATFEDEKTAAVLAGYEKILLEECGTIEKGGIRTIGTTGEVPFVAFFVAESVDEQNFAKIKSALAKIKGDVNLRKSLETKDGVQFVESTRK